MVDKLGKVESGVGRLYPANVFAGPRLSHEYEAYDPQSFDEIYAHARRGEGNLGAPAHFPKGIKLPIKAEGDGKLEAGYASGPIKPGKSVTVTLVKAGTYLIGCAYHYDLGMHDVLVVGPHATPGPQATPTPHGGGGSGSGSGWGG